MIPLPDDDLMHDNPNGKDYAWGHSDNQLRTYAAACVAEERERCIKIITSHQVPVGNSAAGEMAADWTMDALREIRNEIKKGPT